MLASPTWPSSYLHVHKDERTLFYVFLIKGHHSDLYLNVPLSAVPVCYNDFQGGTHQFYVLFCILPTSIPSSGKTQYMEPEPWFEFDMVPSQIEFPTQKIAVDITIIDPAIW